MQRRSVPRLALPLLLIGAVACTRDFELPSDDPELLCGNGVEDSGEGCDDGNFSINDGCPSGPRGSCQPAFCGDGFARVVGVGATEECDDGNDVPGDGCDRCQIEEDWLCENSEPNSPCWCKAGHQDHDGDGSCLPSCDNIDLPPLDENEVCDDSSGTVAHACAPGASVEPEDGRCELDACSPACGIHEKCEAGGTPTCVCRDYWVGADCGTCRVFVDPGAGCTDCDGASWATAIADLQQAIDTASAAALGYDQHCEVWVRAGHYWIYESAPQDTLRLEPWAALYGGFAGTETERVQRDWEVNRTILDGHAGPDSEEQVWHVLTPSSNVIVDGFIITGGRAEGRHGEDDANGGGMLATGAENVRLANCAFVDNSARTDGGAVRSLYSSIVFESCTFSGNETWNDVQYNRGGVLNSSESAIEFDRCVLAGNASDGNIVSLWSAAFADANVVKTTLAVGNVAPAVFDNNWSPSRYYATTIANNDYEGAGKVMHNWRTTVRTFNCIFAAHPGTEFQHNMATTEVTDSILNGICGGQGTCDPLTRVIDAPPQFASVPGTATGTWDTVSWDPERVETTLTDSDAGWTPGALAGRFVQPDTADVRQYPILSNTDSTLVVLGNRSDLATVGGTYQLFDYRLDASSPALDIGADFSADGLTEDLDGNPRNVCKTGTAPDCTDAGAYELQ